jgi:hypothetical protein
MVNANATPCAFASSNLFRKAAERWHNQVARLRAHNFGNETTSKRTKNTENAQIQGKSG